MEKSIFKFAFKNGVSEENIRKKSILFIPSKFLECETIIFSPRC